MGQTVSYINPSNSLFRETFGTWTFTNASVELEANEIVSRNYGSLLITPVSAGSPVVLSLSGIASKIEDAGDTFQFHCRVKSSTGLTVTVSTSESEGGSSVRETDTATNLWNICRSERVVIPDVGETVLISVEISVDGHNGSPFYFTMPFLFASFAIFRDPFMSEVFLNLPEFLREADLEHAEIHDLPDYPLARVIELTTPLAGDAVRDFYFFEYLDVAGGKIEGDTETLSTLVDPDGANLEYLPWLSQFAGVILDNPAEGTTPWGNLPTTWTEMQESIDPSANPVFTPTSMVRATNEVTADIGVHSIQVGEWIEVEGSTATTDSFNGGFEVIAVGGTDITWAQTGADESALTYGTITLLDTEWEEIEAYDPSLGGLEDYLRWQVKYAYNGINAGTRQALVDSVSRELTGDKVVTVTYRYLDDPWQVLVRTKTSETPGGSTGSSSLVIENYIRKVKPAGYKVIHECTVTGA